MAALHILIEVITPSLIEDGGHHPQGMCRSLSRPTAVAAGGSPVALCPGDLPYTATVGATIQPTTAFGPLSTPSPKFHSPAMV